MGTIEFDRVSFAYASGDALLSGCSFRLPPGVTALIGENGAGKSTLMRLVSGSLSPDAGVVRRLPADLRIAHCDERLGKQSEDARGFATSTRPDAHRLRVELGLLEHAGKPWHALSPGLRRRMQLAAALLDEPDVLLLDEPSNHIDEQTRAQLIGVLHSFRGSTLLISHDRALIDAVAAQTWALSAGTLRCFAGGYSAAREALELEQRARQHDKRERERAVRKERQQLDQVRRQQACADSARSARTRMKGVRDHDARGMGRKVTAGWAEARAGRTVGVQRRNVERAEAHARELFVDKAVGRRLFASFTPCPRPHVLELHAETLAYGEHVVLRDVHLALGRRARVRIDGVNGAGKSTLLCALRSSAMHDGERILYVPQEITEQAALARLRELHALDRGQKGQVLDVVAALGVDPDVLLKSAAPSAGEARKLWLALGLGRGAYALLLDEPTNDLDLPSVVRLEAALIDYPGALLVVTHDAHFAGAALQERWLLEHGVVRQAQ